MFKRWSIMIGIFAVLVLAATSWVLYHSRGRLPALAFGGRLLHIALPDHYNYQQRDSRWRDHLLGGYEQAGTLGSHGCTVASIANALSNLGLEMEPDELNRRMSQHGGFNQRGWLVWSAIEPATDGQMQAKTFSTPNRDDVDACLERGEYPIVKYLIGGVVQHWATVVGKSGGTYLIRDPLVESTEPISLTSRTPIILSLRCIGKTI